MKTNLTLDIALDVTDEAAAARLEEAVTAWLAQQQGVKDVRVLHHGDLNSAAWRQARGPGLPNPFGPAGLEGGRH